MAALALLGVVASLGMTAYYWPQLPEEIPHHFGSGGRPDAFGPRGLLLLLPALQIGMYVLMSVVARIPHVYNYPWRLTEENAAEQYRLARELILSLNAFIVLTFGWILWRTIQTAIGNASGIGLLFLPVMLGGTVGLIALYFVRAGRAR